MGQFQQQHQQTVKLAIDCITGELISAESLLVLDEEKFSALRRAAMEARIQRKRGNNSVRFQCAICKGPLYLSRYRGEKSNRWFVHDGKSEQCPWYEGNRLTPNQVKALIYRGQQEGSRHLEYKNFLAKWLGKDTLVSEIDQEKTTFSQVVKGEWRRPDVICKYRGITLVFEIQLSYTFLSDVIARDEFYKRDGIFIIWVFAGFDIHRATVTDEAFFNRRNLFVLDPAAMQHTAENGVLAFNGYRQIPQLSDAQLFDEWAASFITLKDVIFPSDNFRPYFFDYNSALKSLKIEKAKLEREKKENTWQMALESYIDLAKDYYNKYESQDAENAKAALLSKVGQLEEHDYWRHDFASLREYNFYGWHGVLSVLLSIKLNQPISYNKKLTIFRIIEAGVRTGYRDVGNHAFAIMYLWAYKAYKPDMTPKNKRWLLDYAYKIKASIERGENTYRRFNGYDGVIRSLFPEMIEFIDPEFGCASI